MLPKKVFVITYLQNKGNLHTINLHQDVFEISLNNNISYKDVTICFILYRPRNIDPNQFNLNNFVEEKMFVKPPNDLQLANG